MPEQLHKRFTGEEVKRILDRYVKKELKVNYVMQLLHLKRTQFFAVLKKYQQDPENFSILYSRHIPNRSISSEIEVNILKELAREKELIQNQSIPINRYNYSYIQTLLLEKYDQSVSLPTIIERAKKHGFYIPKRERKVHDREVMTNYVGELVQHDTSHHLFAPCSETKWYLISSLDDYSRFILFARFFEKENSWNHILALEEAFLKWGVPCKYYVDNHSIFRFLEKRDTVWRNHVLKTDAVSPQWKQVLDDCKVEVIYALSPQAKGKIERPYRWLQDRIVRTCVREQITSIADAQKILDKEIDRYNYQQVHSTTGEIPNIRFQQSLKKNQSLFKDFKVPHPFISYKDIFCFRMQRMVDAYHNISVNNLKLKVHDVPLREDVLLRIVPDRSNEICEVRIWYKNALTDVYSVKFDDLKLVRF